MARSFCYPISLAQAGKTVEEFLHGEDYSRRLVIALKQTPDGLTIAGERVRSTRRLAAGEALTVTLPTDPVRNPALTMAVPILYEDADICIYHKPAGLVCHTSGSHREDTLENLSSGTFRAMNRLDKDTSGALLTAKHPLAAGRLWQKIEKTYWAITAGGWASPMGEITLPLDRIAPFEPKQMVCPDGKPARTRYRVVAADGEISLVECRLDTGRMHQIRVHLAAMGHPLLGDALYGGDTAALSRQALHCASLSFFHPITREPMEIVAPLPADLAAILETHGLSLPK